MKELVVHKGNIYLSSNLYNTYFNNIPSVILLYREESVLIMPVSGAGGLIMKIKNAKGDRVIHALEFFLDNNLNTCNEERSFPVSWDSEKAALSLEISSPEEP